MSYTRYSKLQKCIECKRACGHVEKTWVYNPNDYIRQIEEQKLCHDCYCLERKLQDTKENHALNLPDLQGSQKQIDWAISIRVRFWKKFEQTYQICSEIIDYINKNLSEDQLAAAKNEDGYKFWVFWSKNRLNASAKFWIDARGELSKWDSIVDTIEMPEWMKSTAVA